jgi:hypothetical protein
MVSLNLVLLEHVAFGHRALDMFPVSFSHIWETVTDYLFR